MSHARTFKRGHCRAVGFTIIVRRGRQMPNAKLSDESVAEMRQMAAEGVSIEKIIRRFRHLKVHAQTIRSTIRGERWSHVTGDKRDGS